jgi:hypothetical protein
MRLTLKNQQTSNINKLAEKEIKKRIPQQLQTHTHIHTEKNPEINLS